MEDQDDASEFCVNVRSLLNLIYLVINFLNI